MKRIINYLPFFVLFFLPLLFYPGVDTSGWRSGSDVHALLEFASSLLAITVGIMVLLHFFTTGRRFFLIISIGFVLIGAEEFVHALFSFNRIWSAPPSFKLAISTTWLAGNFILATSFFIALLFGKKEIIPAKRGPTAVVSNIIGLICAATVALVIFNMPFLPDFVQLGSIAKKLTELSLAFLYFVIFLFYSNIYVKQQSHSPLLWSIVACIIFRVLVHIFVFDAQAFYDSHWDVAHLIVFLSYFFPIFGVWGETIKLHKLAQVQVIELGKEMTERKLADINLKENLLFLQTLIDTIPNPLFYKDIKGEYLSVNRAFEEFYGINKEEIIGKNVYDMGPKHIADKYHEKDQELFQFPGKQTYEWKVVNAAGKTRDVIFNKASYANQEGTVTGLIGVISDITERKMMEEALRESEERFRAIIENAPFNSLSMKRTNLLKKPSHRNMRRLNEQIIIW